ncbi:MAG: hypothetical protein KAJ46_01205 [Sedimentisphaerales bacterium]|nr:hypothetical protein [Sedimentisphaerales bacterium]
MLSFYIRNYSAVRSKWIFPLTPDFSPVLEVSPPASSNRFNGFLHIAE